MKVKIAVGVLLLASVAAVQAQQPVSKPGAKSTSALESKVRAVWEGFQKKDKAAVAALLDDKFRTLSDGDSKFGDKKAEVAEVDEYTIDKYELTDFHTEHVSPHTAIVTYTADFSGKYSGQPVHTRGIFGEVWVKNGTEWKCAYKPGDGTALNPGAVIPN